MAPENLNYTSGSSQLVTVEVGGQSLIIAALQVIGNTQDLKPWLARFPPHEQVRMLELPQDPVSHDARHWYLVSLARVLIADIQCLREVFDAVTGQLRDDALLQAQHIAGLEKEISLRDKMIVDLEHEVRRLQFVLQGIPLHGE